MKLSTGFRKAAKWLSHKQWLKGTSQIHRARRGCTGACAYGALEYVGAPLDDSRQFLSRYFLDVVNLFDFNDHYAQSRKDIIALFNLAADYAEAHGK